MCACGLLHIHKITNVGDCMVRGGERGERGGRERERARASERETEREREREREHTYPSFESVLPQKCPCGTLSYTGGPRCVHCGGGK